MDTSIVTDTIRRCKRCNESKPLSGFPKDKKARNGFKLVCKKCKNASNKPWSDPKQREKIRHRDRLKDYGVTHEQYEAMREQQNDLCAICGKPETRTSRAGTKSDLCVDHCHDTNAVRGLLCSNCNTALGYFKDSIENLSNAIDYLMGMHR